MAEASGGRTGEDIDNKGNLLESIRLSDQNLNIRQGASTVLAQFTQLSSSIRTHHLAAAELQHRDP